MGVMTLRVVSSRCFTHGSASRWHVVVENTPAIGAAVLKEIMIGMKPCLQWWNIGVTHSFMSLLVHIELGLM